MARSYEEKERFIKKLFDYEESHKIPDNRRLTFDPYANIPEIPDPSPRKKAYVDIRVIINTVKDLMHRGEI